MGVKLDFFCCVAAELQDFKFGQETNSRLYFYRAFESQTIDDMLEPGFFNEAQDLRVGDLILLYAPNQNRGYAFAKVISTTNGIVSTQSIGLKAQDVAVDTDEFDRLSGENLQKIIEKADEQLNILWAHKADTILNFQTPITEDNLGATMAEIDALDNDLQAQITSNDADILKNTQDITALKGAGGALNASNFNTATPTQKTLTKYAVDQIWPGNTNWAWNAANPAASTFTDVNGVARTAAEIFNSTWVNNTYDDHRWQLTNTQNTTPKVFEWADVGRDIVSVATATTAGIVRVGSGSQMVVNPVTGDISLDGTKASGIRSTIGALASNQGSSNSGLILGIDGSGNVVPTESSSGGRNIGDIFWTARTDSALAGAVECNGAQYNFADVNRGQNNIQALLDSGALPSVTVEEFDSKVATNGSCGVFGYKTSGESFLYGYSGLESFYGTNPTLSVGDKLFYCADISAISDSSMYVCSATVTKVSGSTATVSTFDPTPGSHSTSSITGSIRGNVVKNNVQTTNLSQKYAYVGNINGQNTIVYSTTTAYDEEFYTLVYVANSATGKLGVGNAISINSGTLMYHDGINTIACSRNSAYDATFAEAELVDISSQPTAYFKVPKVQNVYIQANDASKIGDFISECLPNITGSFESRSVIAQTGAFASTNGSSTPAGTSDSATEVKKTLLDASLSSQVYKNGAKVQPDSICYRPMVQLFNGVTDDAVATCTQALQQIANIQQVLNSARYVIYCDGGDATDHSHAAPGVATPAAGVWYRFYNDGFVEQGGPFSGGPQDITMPITMKNTGYSCYSSCGSRGGINWSGNPITMVPLTTNTVAIRVNGDYTDMTGWWEVKGYGV